MIASIMIEIKINYPGIIQKASLWKYFNTEKTI